MTKVHGNSKVYSRTPETQPWDLHQHQNYVEMGFENQQVYHEARYFLELVNVHFAYVLWDSLPWRVVFCVERDYREEWGYAGQEKGFMCKYNEIIGRFLQKGNFKGK